MEKSVLVGLGKRNRNRPVKFATLSGMTDLEALDKAVRAMFEDILLSDSANTSGISIMT